MKTLLLFLFLSIAATAETITGTVLKINDGDSFILRSGDNAYSCRLWGIDAPEMRQRFGFTSRSMLWEMIKDKRITVTVKDTDRYKRKVVQVIYKDRDVALEMLKTGLAWWYKRYAPNEKAYEEAFNDARKSGRGLWIDPNPVNPETFRASDPEQ